MNKAFAAILGGLKDVIFGRLTLFAIGNFIVAVAITATAATLLIRFVVPLIPDGGGWLAYVSTAGEFAASVAGVVLAELAKQVQAPVGPGSRVSVPSPLKVLEGIARPRPSGRPAGQRAREGDG